MSKAHWRRWRNRVLSLVLAASMLLEPSMVSSAAGVSDFSEGIGILAEAEQNTEPEENTEPSVPSEPAESGPAKMEEPDGGTVSDGTVSGDDMVSGNGDVSADQTVSGNEVVETSGVIPVSATSEDFVIENNMLVKYNGTDSYVEIPEGVVAIDDRVFEGNSDIQRVKFPSTMKDVKDNAFNGCINLQEVEMNDGLSQIGSQAFYNSGLTGTLTIPGSVDTLESDAFHGCEELEEVIFANGSATKLSMGDYVFRDCTSLQRVTLSNAVEVIPAYAFASDAKLEEVTFGDALTSISRDAFLQCSALKKVECPATLTSIGDRAFSGCTQLREVQLPEGLLSIGTEAFASVGFGGKTETQATVYGTLTIPGTVTSIGDRAFWKSPYLEEVTFSDGTADSVTLGEAVFRECESLKKVTLSDAVKVLPKNAFGDCSALTEVDGTQALTAIQDYAFACCTELRKITLPEGLLSIGTEVFASAGLGGKTATQAIEYGTVTIPSTVTTIGERAFWKSTYLGEVIFAAGSVEEIKIGEAVFQECKNLKKATLSDAVTVVPEYAFAYDAALEEVTFGEKMTYLSRDAFLQCSALKEVTFPATLATIGDRAFSGCTELRKVQFAEGLESIGTEAFASVGFGGRNKTQAMEYGTLTIPSTVTSIGDRAFWKSTYLGEVIFTAGTVTQMAIGEAVFRDCESLKKVTLSDSVTQISNYTFAYDSALEEVTLGTKTNAISNDAFYKCSALKTLECPATLLSIGDRAFFGCTGLRTVQLQDGLLSIGTEAFAEAGFGGKTETQTTEYGTLTIPGTVISIGERAFRKSPYLGEVIFANGQMEALTLEENVFWGCENLKKITFPDRLQDIAANTCAYCTSLEQIVFGKKVNKIGKAAFYQCTSLKEVDIPGTVETVGEEAFANCTALQTVWLQEGIQVIGARAFSAVPFGGKDEKQKLVYGSLTIPSTVYEIGDGAFRKCTYLEEVIFTNGAIESLEFKNDSSWQIFDNCENLKRIYLPNRLQSIPKGIIANCPNLEQLYIPAGVESIDDEFLKDSRAEKLTIYGDFGTAAEQFAKNHNIPFKDKKELSIYVKSISLNRKNISLSGEEALGTQIALQVTVLPATAINKGVLYTSENEQVAKVDQKGVVTITGYGQTRICVTSAEDDSIKAYCEVSVLKKWTQDEVDTVLQYLQDNNEHYLLTNVYASVKDLELQAPEGITVEWKEPGEEVQTGAHRYTLRLQQDGYEAVECEGFTIYGLTVTGVELESAFLVQTGKQHSVSLKVLTEGIEGESLDYQIEWSSANANVSVKGEADSLNAVVTGNKASKNVAVTVKLVLNRDGKAVSIDKKDLGKTWFTTTCKVTVCDYAIADEIKVTVKQDGADVELDALADLYSTAIKQTYELQAQAFAEGELIENAALTWKSNNPKIAAVKTDKTGKTTLEALGKGTALITVTASKNGGYVYSFRVVVKDSKPRLLQKTVTMNRYLQIPSAEITLLPSDGFTVDESRLVLLNAKDNSVSLFQIQKGEGDNYIIFVENADELKKGSYALKLLTKTDEYYEFPITIKVVEQKPKVTIWQKPINLYEKNGRGVVGIETEADIASITYTPAAGIGSVRLVQDMVGESAFTVKAENAQANNFAKAANKGTLKITFKDYQDTVYYESKITLAVNKAPKLAGRVQSATLYPETAADTTQILVSNTNGSMGRQISVTTPAGYSYEEGATSSDPITLQALRGAKAGKVVLTVTDDSWFDTVRPQVSCAIKIGKTPKLSLASSVITLNTAYLVPEYDAVGVEVSVKGFEDLKFADESAQFTGKNAQAKEVLDRGVLQLSMEDGKVCAGLTDADYFKKAGNYDYEVVAYTSEGKSVKGSFRVSVVLASKAPAVSISTKGEINLLERDSTYVELTPKIKNYTGQISLAELSGTNADRFELSVKDGKIAVYAVSGANIKANTVYNLGLKVTLDSGVELKTTIKITPRQKVSKLVSSAKTVTLYETAKGESYGQGLTISALNAAGKKLAIETISLADSSDTFGYTQKADGEGVLYVKDEASMVAGKTYTLKLQVTFEDSATNVKPSYVTVKVVYNK